MKVVAYLLAAVLGLLAFVFVVGSQGQVLRIVVGVVLLAAAIALLALPRLRPQIVQRTQRIELSGDVSLEALTCAKCGGNLSKKNLTVQAGAVFVDCPYCGAHYQLEEAPKW
ncbi:MAG: hypothetical protein D6729_07770 [Deltaproteobacteria bacterium]|nr:MAG: hypothetical protein D6729_07770 [Deltaproteobacteria bacterium]